MYASQVVWFDSNLLSYPDVAILHSIQSFSIIMMIKTTSKVILIFGFFLNVEIVKSQLAPAYEWVQVFSVSLRPSMYFLTTKYIIYFLYLPHYKRLNILVLYDDSLVQGLEGKANVESNLNSILSYSQYWMRHTTLDIKFELKMESHPWLV